MGPIIQDKGHIVFCYEAPDESIESVDSQFGIYGDLGMFFLVHAQDCQIKKAWLFHIAVDFGKNSFTLKKTTIWYHLLFG